MHVALNAYFWNQPFTGSGQYTRQLVFHLNRYVSDLDITLIHPKIDGTTALEDVPPSVRVVSLQARTGYIGKVLFEQVQFPRACRNLGATVAHVPYWGGPLSSTCPLIVTVHDLTTMLVPEYRRKLSARLYIALVSAGARTANHIITDSFSSKLDIVDHLRIKEEDVTAIYLAAGSQFSPAENSLTDMAVLRKYDLPDFYILYLGGYVLHKNVTTLLSAYTYVARALGEDYPLVLAGKKPQQTSAVFPDYDNLIQQLNLEKFVRWIGPVDEEDKAVLYRNAETFVFPSRLEGFGLGPLEALACGTPVVTTNSSSLPEVVGAAAFAVDAEDAREMAGAIISSVMDDNLRADLKRKGLQQAAKFSWQTTATETALIYDRVIRQ
ncbi:MAG: glycosyltransferase family 1 protein [Candidatus Promineifilaceae bacterium]|nr:glycosyltransferase family 1 protein [Candidatus Promineifilaceae bacterium]